MSKDSVAFEDTISLHQVREHLQRTLAANDFEIERWILDGRIQAYCHHRFRDDNSCSKAEPWRGDPDHEGPEIGHNGMPKIYGPRRFLREDVDRFDPSSPSFENWKPEQYPEFGLAGVIESDDPIHHGFNPSGRFVTFRLAAEFLGGLGDAEDVVGALRTEVADDRIWTYGPGIDEPLLEDSCFAEAQILGWATTCYGVPFDGWDAVTRGRVTEATASDDASETKGIEGLTQDALSAAVGKSHCSDATRNALNNPRDLEITVRVDDNMVDVRNRREEWNREYSRDELLGKATTTWFLLVLFARHYNSVPSVFPGDEKRLNTSTNRRNLSDQLKRSLGLNETPRIHGKASALKFASIVAQRDRPDAMTRKRGSIDDATTEFLAANGYDEPLID